MSSSSSSTHALPSISPFKKAAIANSVSLEKLPSTLRQMSDPYLGRLSGRSLRPLKHSAKKASKHAKILETSQCPRKRSSSAKKLRNLQRRVPFMGLYLENQGLIRDYGQAVKDILGEAGCKEELPKYLNRLKAIAMKEQLVLEGLPKRGNGEGYKRRCAQVERDLRAIFREVDALHPLRAQIRREFLFDEATELSLSTFLMKAGEGHSALRESRVPGCFTLRFVRGGKLLKQRIFVKEGALHLVDSLGELRQEAFSSLDELLKSLRLDKDQFHTKGNLNPEAYLAAKVTQALSSSPKQSVIELSRRRHSPLASSYVIQRTNSGHEVYRRLHKSPKVTAKAAIVPADGTFFKSAGAERRWKALASSSAPAMLRGRFLEGQQLSEHEKVVHQSLSGSARLACGSCYRTRSALGVESDALLSSRKGMSLAGALKQYGDQMTVDDKRALFIQICKGVQEMHQRGFIHRDLCLDNILVNVDTDKISESEVFLTDFGLSLCFDKDLVASAPEALEQAGSPSYADVEYFYREPRGFQAGAAADIFSLAVLYHNLLLGREGSELTSRIIFSGVLQGLADAGAGDLAEKKQLFSTKVGAYLKQSGMDEDVTNLLLSMTCPRRISERPCIQQVLYRA